MHVGPNKLTTDVLDVDKLLAVILFVDILNVDKLSIDTLFMDTLLAVILFTEMLVADKLVMDTLLVVEPIFIVPVVIPEPTFILPVVILLPIFRVDVGPVSIVDALIVYTFIDKLLFAIPTQLPPPTPDTVVHDGTVLSPLLVNT